MQYGSRVWQRHRRDRHHAAVWQRTDEPRAGALAARRHRPVHVEKPRRVSPPMTIGTTSTDVTEDHGTRERPFRRSAPADQVMIS